jgi:hypothetical protein
MTVENFLTSSDKVASLLKVRDLLSKDIYTNLLMVGVDPDTFDYETVFTSELLNTPEVNGPQSEHLAKASILRSMEKLNFVLSKLEELNNA